MHKGCVDLIQAVIYETSSLTLALQAIAYYYTANTYYVWQPYFGDNATQTLRYSVDAVQPVHNQRFTVVVVAIVCHALLLTHALPVFEGGEGIKRLSYVSIDQAWPVFGQVSQLAQDLALSQDQGNQELDSKLCSTTTTDKEAEKEIRQRGPERKVYALVDDSEDGTTRFKETVSTLRTS